MLPKDRVGSDSVIRRCSLNVRFSGKRTRLGDLWAPRYRVETEGFLSTVVTVTPNFALLEMSHPEVASLVAAMLQARDAVERRSWAQEPTGEEWWCSRPSCWRTLVLAQAVTPRRIDDDVQCGKRETRRARR